MIPEEEALSRILGAVQPLLPREVALQDSLGCFAAADVFARVALPGFDNSAMDGYAVVANGCSSPGARLLVTGEQPAGRDRQLVVRNGEAVRVLTGAPLPRGADAVVMQEDVTLDGDTIVVNCAVEQGEFIRRRGADVAEGQKILSRGQRITPQVAALLASQGMSSVSVGGKVRVAVISTGDELARAGEPLLAGKIYDSNSTLLQLLARRAGAEVVWARHCADDEEEITAAVGAGVACDVLLISGGVSVGARDFVKAALTAAGTQLELWRVAVKPGKPFLFGRAGNCSVFGLPGNPVSAFVTFLLFVRPAVLQLMGAAAAERHLHNCRVSVSQELRNSGDRPHYLRGAVRDGVFQPVGKQESHALFGLSRADALLRLGCNETIAAGSSATVLLID
jgi:molybdopterin molybdotransferase